MRMVHQMMVTRLGPALWILYMDVLVTHDVVTGDLAPE